MKTIKWFTLFSCYLLLLGFNGTDAIAQSGTKGKLVQKKSMKTQVATSQKVWKADNGDGVILKSVEMKGKNENVSFEFYNPFKNAQKVNLIEEDAGKAIGGNSNLLKVCFRNNSIESYKINFQ